MEKVCLRNDAFYCQLLRNKPDLAIGLMYNRLCNIFLFHFTHLGIPKKIFWLPLRIKMLGQDLGDTFKSVTI